MTHQSPRRDYYSHYHYNGLLTDSDVCIGKLTPSSITTLNKVLELPTHFSKAGGNSAQDVDVDADVEEDVEETDAVGAAPLAIDAKYLFEKPATITRARIKS